MWVVGPFFLQNKREGFKKFIKKLIRIKKLITLAGFRIKRKIRHFKTEILKKLWHNKIILGGAFVIVFSAVIVFSVMTSERFPYDLNLFLKSDEFLPLLGSANDSSSYIEMGSGLLSFNRYEDIAYTIKEGESLPEIAYLYNVEVIELMLYNNIDSLEAATRDLQIKIPSAGNIMNFMENVDRDKLSNAISSVSQAKIKSAQNLLPKEVKISCEKRSDGQSITAFFSVADDIREKGVYFEWDLGDGKKSFRKTFNYTYNAPGTYVVRLTVKDIYGNQVSSNPVYMDIPHATNLKNTNQIFITVNNVGDIFSLDGKVTMAYDALGRVDDPILFVNASEGKYYYQAHASGNFSLTALTKSGEKKVYLFVSPWDSVNSDRTDIDWYRTQYGTGFSNCGPSIASMAIGWSTGEYVSVTTVRDLIGWTGDGSTSFFDLKRALEYFAVPHELVGVHDAQALFSMVDHGSIIGFVYECGEIAHVTDNPQTNLVGKYYQDATGHYSIIKGYTKDKKYFIVYDPIPSDWINNGLRYGDGISMIGRNRYYPVEEVYDAMYTGLVLEIKRSAEQAETE